MDYLKRPLTIAQQIEKLKSRGLSFSEGCNAEHYLTNISYYRLRAYTFPFQNNEDNELDHQFVRNGISFSDIIDLYCFDRRLRVLLFNAIEKIEIAFRAKIVQLYSESTNDSHWYSDSDLYKDTFYLKSDGKKIFLFDELMEDVYKEINRSNEDFIKHYNKKYSNPDLPPAWMVLEVISFGTLSRMYDLLLKSDTKLEIAKSFGLPNDKILVNWMHSISVLRNCCAHHSRVWNRRYIVNVIFPYNTSFPFMNRESITLVRTNKLFAILCCIKYILDIISPQSDFKNNFVDIQKNAGSLLRMKDMGFVDNWKYLGVWRDK